MDEQKKHQGDEVQGDKGKIIIKDISGSVSEVYGGDHTEVHNTYNEESEETRTFRKVVGDFFNGLNKLGQSLLLAGVVIVLIFVFIVLPLKIMNWVLKPITQPMDDLIEGVVAYGDLWLYGTSNYTMKQYQDDYELVSFRLPDFLGRVKQPAFSSARDTFNMKFGNFSCDGCGNHIEITIFKTPWASLDDKQWKYLRTSSLLSIIPDSTHLYGSHRDFKDTNNRRYGKEEYRFYHRKLDSLFRCGVILDFQDHILFEVKYLFSQRVYSKMDSIWTLDNFRWNPSKADLLLRYPIIGYPPFVKAKSEGMEYDSLVHLLDTAYLNNPMNMSILYEKALLYALYDRELDKALKISDGILMHMPEDSIAQKLKGIISKKIEKQIAQ